MAGAAIGVRPEAVPAYLALVIAAAELADDGRPMPCQRWPDAFTSEDHRERAEAAEACTHCPLLARCSEYADTQRETWHVWAGVDRTPKPKKEIAA